MKFLLGAIVGSVGTLYVIAVVQNYRAIRENERSLTNLFNSVPPDQRHGYTEDFPPNTHWEL